MANKVCLVNAKKPTLLTQKLNYLNTLQIHLYTNRATVSPPGAVTLGSFTMVVDGGASSPYPTMALSTASVNGSYQAQSTGTPITYTFQVPGGTPYTVMGFVAIDPLDGNPVFYQDLDTPVNVGTAGQQLTINPQFLDDTMP
jgi:hypothetical protein